MTQGAVSGPTARPNTLGLINFQNLSVAGVSESRESENEIEIESQGPPFSIYDGKIDIPMSF